MIAEVVKSLGSLDCLVANAGIAAVGSLLDSTEEGRKVMFDVNVHGVMNCEIAAARQMVKQGEGGRIIGA